MERIKTYTEFLLEAQFALNKPGDAGNALAGILSKNRDVKEQPKASNRGPEVEAYLKSTGLGGGYPWCMAFVYYIFNELSKKLGTTNPLPKTAGVMSHWNKAGSGEKIQIADIRKDPNLMKPGQIFIMKFGGNKGHTGIIIDVDPAKKTFSTMEGNTNDQRSREGDRVGVNTRKMSDRALVGVVDYFKNTRTPEFAAALKKGAIEYTGQSGQASNSPSLLALANKEIPDSPLTGSDATPSADVIGGNGFSDFLGGMNIGSDGKIKMGAGALKAVIDSFK
jgi:hypothetical protein